MRCHCAITAALILSTLGTTTIVHAQSTFLETDGPRHRVGIGSWTFASEDDGRQNTLEALGIRREGTSLHYSYSFFRPRRHEATVDFQWFARSERDGLGAIGEAATNAQLARTIRRDTVVVSSEYRWRFGGQGKAWYGMGLGLAQAGRGPFGVGVSSLGYDFDNRWTAEFRSVSDDKEGMLGTLVIGVRF